MTIYVISDSDKLLVSQSLKSKYIEIYNWNEYVNYRNKQLFGNKKSKYFSEELISLEFNTCLNSFKNDLGLKECIFVISQNSIKQIEKQFNIIEIL